MKNNISFPTQGELVTYAFNVFGILPTKHASDPDFNEEAKVTFQRLLGRLKEEQGLLQKNFEQALATLDKRLSRNLPAKRDRKIIIGVLADLYRNYNQLFIEEGTYRPKSDTLLYFLFTRATSTMVEAVTFQSLRQRISIRDVITEENLNLFLPDITSEGKPTWPLAKVLRWTYTQAGCSQIQFHYPGKTAESDNPKYTQNLENAVNWVRSKSMPSLPALLANFTESIDAQPEKGKVSESLAKSLPLMLALARLSTAICQDIARVYGTENLRTLVEDLQRYFSAISPEIDEFEEEARRAHETDDLTQLLDLNWHNTLEHYRSHFLRKQQLAQEQLTQLQKGSPSFPFKPPVIESMKGRLGLYPVISRLDPIIYSAGWMPSPEFVRFLNKGFELKKHSGTSATDIERFEQQLAETGVEDQLSWLAPWIRAVHLYKADRFGEAWPHFEQAYTLAKYRAGKSQYLLVNQYLEVCAKTNRRGKFKQALDWATYAGIKVRWIRNEEQTKEAIDYAFHMLKAARYSI